MSRGWMMVAMALFLLGMPVAIAHADAKVTSEWHEGNWEQGGYYDHDTIVTVPKAKQEVLPPKPVLPESPKGYAILIKNEPYQEEFVPMVPKAKLHGPSMGFQGARRIVTHRAGTHMETWKLAPSQTEMR